MEQNVGTNEEVREESFSKKVERIFKEAVLNEIRKHAEAGNPVCYMHEGRSEIFEALLDPVTLEPIWERIIYPKTKEV